ncbi:MAG TPA: hypothetical protein ENJ51_01535 [Leucothrix mucor]|uniref:Uncharacterized protein n=1 Tax=Leucothrix mucor TaxID=45248 RepID=A0A7V2WU68_LEUMU|nr:hypothetical protein [Leucothrix mucor]
MTLSLIFLTPLITYAKNEAPIDKFAEAKAEPKGVIPVIKLEDIIAGKHSGKIIEKNDKHDKHQSISSSKTIKKQAKQKKQKEPSAKKTETVKPTESQPSINLEEAYSVLMNSDNTASKDKKKIVKASTHTNKATITASADKAKGWIYLGKFNQGQWDNKNNQTLGLNAALPRAGQYYSLRVHSNIRNTYPSRGGMPPVRQVLSKGSKVRVLTIHNSGKSGHYWAKVEW